VVPIYCIEQEWSLWARDIEEEIVPTCRELGRSFALITKNPTTPANIHNPTHSF